MTKICVMRPAAPYHGVHRDMPVRYLKSYGWTEDGATYETTELRAEAYRLSDYDAYHLDMGELHDLLVAAHGHWDVRYVWHFEEA